MKEVQDVKKSQSCGEEIDCKDYFIDVTQAKNITFVVVALYSTDIKAFTDEIRVEI